MVAGRIVPGVMAAGDQLAALGDGVGDQGIDALAGLRAHQRAEHDVALARIAAAAECAALAANFSTNASATVSSTTMRSVDMQIWPWFM